MIGFLCLKIVIEGDRKMKKGKLKQILSFVLSLVLVISMVFVTVPGEVKAADGVNVSINANKTEVHRGDTVTITVELSDNTAARGAQIKFAYDSDKLELQGKAVKGAAFEGSAINSLSDEKIGSINAIITMADSPIKNGTVFTATFKVKETAGAGEIPLSFRELKFAADSSERVPATEVNNASNLKVVVPLTGISLNKSETTIAKDSTEKLTATLSPADAEAEITWKSSNDQVATVKDGTVTAVGKGTATITAEAGGKSATCKVTVTVPLKGISIKGDVNTLKKGQNTKLAVVYDPEDADNVPDVEWTSSKDSVATVSKDGVVTAIADGTATITAKVGNLTAEYEITVQEVKLNGISLDKTETTIHRGETANLTVKYDPENTTDDRTVNWSSSDPGKVTVDAKGEVKAIAVGEAIIKAQVGNHTATCTVTVDSPLESILPNLETIKLVKHQTAELTYKLVPEDTTYKDGITYSSSDNKVVTVDEKGKVTAVAAGTATITLTATNGIKAEIPVTVTELPIKEVTLDKKSAIVEKGETVELTANVGPVDTTDDDKSIAWSVKDETVAKVSASKTQAGETVTITAISGGVTTVTAEAWNGTKATCVITVPIHLEGVEINADDQNTTMLRNSTKVLGVTYQPENVTDEVTCTWSSSNPKVATVDPKTGMITALAKGETEITVKAATETQSFTAKTTVTVKENHFTQDLADKLKLDIKEALLKGQSVKLSECMNLSQLIDDYNVTDDITVAWKVEDEEIAAVDQTGSLLGLKEGKTTVKATITATDGNGNESGTYTVSGDVEVKEIPLESIAFNKVIKEMKVGEVQTLSILYNPENTTDVRDVVWTSSDEKVLAVKDGKLTALKAGVAEITAKVGEKSISCKITVKENTAGTGKDQNTETTNKKTDKKTGNTKTGDSANVAGYFLAMVLAIFAVWAVVRKRITR